MQQHGGQYAMQGSGGHHVMQGGHHTMQGSGGHHAMQGGIGMGGGYQSSGGAMKYSSSSTSAHSSSMSVFGQDAFCEIMPSSFPPGTDPKVIECYNRIDRDNNGIIDDKELQSVLTNCNHSFSLRTVHLLMFEFTHSNKRMIGPKEFVPLLKCLQTWRSMFQRFDRDRNGSIDSQELGQSLTSLGFRVSPVIVNMLVSKFSKTGRCALRYDSFIECILTVKGLTETFNAKADCGKATFYYEEFLFNVLPFIIA
uniref:EF-hand calcium binding protein n=1 Tax=Suaeda glauca TaxID=397272 RepID=V5PZR7_9CARY|nr:EF-hand calcium binding protein [Suaeda glauca]